MEQSDLLRLMAQTLDRLEIPYLVTGSIASMAYGEPRQTHDIDIVVRLPVEKVETLCQQFPDPEFYVSVDAARDAVRHQGQFNIIVPEWGIKVDLIISGTDSYSKSRFSRAKRIRVSEDVSPSFSSPEDVIISKIRFHKEGGSDKHLRDITGILKRMGDEIDRTYIAEWAAKLDVLDIWQVVLERVESR